MSSAFRADKSQFLQAITFPVLYLFSLDTPGELFYSSKWEKGILITDYWSASHPSSSRATFGRNFLYQRYEMRDAAETCAILASQCFLIGQRHIYRFR